jgi:hypothetical protein
LGWSYHDERLPAACCVCSVKYPCGAVSIFELER